MKNNPVFGYLIGENGDILVNYHSGREQIKLIKQIESYLFKKISDEVSIPALLTGLQVPSEFSISVHHYHGYWLIIGMTDLKDANILTIDLISQLPEKYKFTPEFQNKMVSVVKNYFLLQDDRTPPKHKLTINEIFKLPAELQDLAMGLLRVKVGTLEMIQSEIDDDKNIRKNLHELIDLGYLGCKITDGKEIYYIMS